jgi:hypothetical protein
MKASLYDEAKAVAEMWKQKEAHEKRRTEIIREAARLCREDKHPESVAMRREFDSMGSVCFDFTDAMRDLCRAVDAPDVQDKPLNVIDELRENSETVVTHGELKQFDATEPRSYVHINGPEQINIAIAESLGWTCIWDSRKYFKGINGYPPGYTGNRNAESGRVEIPNYCNDLNAMHDAEKSLPLRSRMTYLDHLGYDGSTTGCVFGTVTTPAMQRAEAYLRTIGKWVES